MLLITRKLDAKLVQHGLPKTFKLIAGYANVSQADSEQPER